MPYSGCEFDEVMQKIVHALAPSTCLDIGVGAGKTANMVKAHVPKCKVFGMEAEPSYAGKFEQQWRLYEHVWVGDAVDLSLGKSAERFDLVVFGDVIEHMWHCMAFDLLRFWSARSKLLLVVWPIGFHQDAHGGVVHEIHRGFPTLRDFANNSSLDVVRFHKFYREYPSSSKCLAVLRGSRGDAPQMGVTM